MQGKGTSKSYEVRTAVIACCALYAYLQAYYWNSGSVNWAKVNEQWANAMGGFGFNPAAGEQLGQPDGKSAAAVKLIQFYAYQYGSASWGDQLTGITQYSITSINNSPTLMILSTQSFSYDSMGNPTGYHDKTLTWEGKQLTGSAASTSGQTLSYAYDQNGLRTQKTVTPTTNGTSVTPNTNGTSVTTTTNGTATATATNGTADITATNGTADITATNGIAVTTNYYYNGSVLMGMVTGSGTTAIHQLFSYDASGNVVSVDYSSNGGSSFTTYYYLRNAQNDVVKLIDGSGTTVVSYTYDSWGKLIATMGALASTVGQNQPFRYRGYVIVGRMCSSDNSDTETGWYYLQSRYYDPTTCHFISADVLLSTGQGVLGHNAFAYCLNNPVNMSDEGGGTPRPTPGLPPIPTPTPTPNPGHSPDDIYIIISISLNGPPNSYIDRGKGQWRYYGSDGRAYEDYDQPHNGHNYWHKHKWKWNGDDADRGNPERADPPEGWKQRKSSSSIDKILGGAVTLGAGLLTVLLLADDITGIGTFDDPLITITSGWFVYGLTLIGG